MIARDREGSRKDLAFRGRPLTLLVVAIARSPSGRPPVQEHGVVSAFGSPRAVGTS